MTIRHASQRTLRAARPGAGLPRPLAVLVPALLLALFTVAAPASAAPAPTAGPPEGGEAIVSVNPGASVPGQTVSVNGAAWVPGSLVQASVCGENGLRGSANCSMPNAVTATVGTSGDFASTLPVVVPPSPCPCVVRVASITGGTPREASVPLEIEGAPFAPLPTTVKTPPRMVFIDSRMAGSDSVFTWFGSPVQRRFEIEVGNTGQTPIVNPTFRMGFYEGVYAPEWSEVRWQGTIGPGKKAVIRLPVELKPRQHGEFSWRVMYEDQIVDEQALRVGRPWGVYIFGALLVLVVPMTAWRLVTRIIEVVREQRGQRRTERDREVGLSAESTLKPAAAKADSAMAEGESAPATGEPTDATPAKNRVAGGTGTASAETSPDTAERTTAPRNSKPVRSMLETVAISGPLYADSAPGEDDHPAGRGGGSRV